MFLFYFILWILAHYYYYLSILLKLIKMKGEEAFSRWQFYPSDIIFSELPYFLAQDI